MGYEGRADLDVQPGIVKTGDPFPVGWPRMLIATVSFLVQQPILAGTSASNPERSVGQLYCAWPVESLTDQPLEPCLTVLIPHVLPPKSASDLEAVGAGFSRCRQG